MAKKAKSAAAQRLGGRRLWRRGRRTSSGLALLPGYCGCVFITNCATYRRRSVVVFRFETVQLLLEGCTSSGALLVGSF